jgi:protein SCO1/2
MTTKTRSHKKLITIILFILTGIVGSVVYFGILQNMPQKHDVKIDGLYLMKPKDMINFQLTDNKGKEYTKANLSGHWTLMFFGFTNCGMVCPVTMAELNSMYKILQHKLPDKQLPEVVMVSVDPERDTVERMDDFVNAFNPHFIGARAEMPQIATLENALHLAAVKMQVGDKKEQYTINHSAEIMVFNPQGQLQAFLSYPHKAQRMAEDYQAMLNAG